MQHVTPYVLIIVSAAEASLQQSVMRTMYQMCKLHGIICPGHVGDI